MLTNLFLSFLDSFFSLPIWIHLIMLIGWIILLRYLVLRMKAHVIVVITIFLIGGVATPIALSLLNNSRWGYGYLHENSIPYFGASDKYLAINDLYTTHSKGGKTHYHHRLYLVDVQNGAILFKKPISGKNGVKGLSFRDDQLLVKSGEKSQYFSLKGKSTRAFDKSKLKNLPELKDGIFKYGYNANTNQAWAINKQGEKFFYNGTTMKRELERAIGVPSTGYFVKIPSKAKFRFSNSTTNRRYNRRLVYCPVKLKGRIRQQLVLEDGQNTEQFFVYGKIQMYFPTLEIALIKSYANTDKKTLKLTAVNKQGKVLWQKTQLQLGVKDFFSNSKPYISYVTPEMYEGDFIILIGGYLQRMNPKTGIMRWQTRL
ncbi:hypothetical protein BKI52_28005 [marine bacterium AO1-C]|nr:hypothetical protein BKI52_28005 [marine bacterium AO1-C]